MENNFQKNAISLISRYRLLKGIAGVILLILALGLGYWLSVHQEFSFEQLQLQKKQLILNYSLKPYSFVIYFLGIYILGVVLALPGLTILNLGAGYIFGVWWGTFFVSVASTLGCTLVFLVSRYLLREFLLEKYQNFFQKLNQKMEVQGAQYLLLIRLFPVLPFFLVNLALGLTPISLRKYFVISQVGMLPMTVLYVAVGTQMQEVASIADLMQNKGLVILLALFLTMLLAQRFFKKGTPTLVKPQ